MHKHNSYIAPDQVGYITNWWKLTINSPIHTALFTLLTAAEQEPCHPKFQVKEPRKPARLRPSAQATRKRRGGGRNPTASTFTKCWNKSTRILESAPKPCLSWILLWMTFSRGFQPRLAVLLTTTREVPSHLVRSRPLSDCSCPVNLPSTPSVREQKPSPSTPPPSRLHLHQPTTTKKSALFRATKSLQNNNNSIIWLIYMTYDMADPILYDP